MKALLFFGMEHEALEAVAEIFVRPSDLATELPQAESENDVLNTYCCVACDQYDYHWTKDDE
jgi:hypothetical protein